MDYRIDDVCPVWGTVTASGDDCTIVVQGGTAPHVGCVVLAVPRPSLSGAGMSATVSCLNRTGHLDDAFAAVVAKRVAAARNCVVACSCGIHIDHATPDELSHIQGLADTVAAHVLALLKEEEEEPL